MTSPRDAEQPTEPTDEERPYFGFISYAREDERAARHIQAALQRVGMPYSMWGRRLRPYWRDSSDLSAGGRPWRDQAFPQLQRSRSLVVICSEHVYDSQPVSEEIDHWLTDAGHGLPGVRPADRLFLVRMDGSLRWDAQTGSYGESSTAAPLALRQPGVFEHEPSYVDLKDIDPLDSDNPLVREQLAGIVAQTYAPPQDKRTIVNADQSARQALETSLRRRLAVARAAALVALALAVTAGVFFVNARTNERVALENEQTALENERTAEQNAEEARRQEALAIERADQATAQRLAAQATSLDPGDNDLALLLAVAGHKLDPGPQTRAALLSALLAAPRVSGYVPLDKTLPAPPVVMAGAGDRLALGSASSTVRIVSTDDAVDVAEHDFDEPARQVAFSPDGALLAVGTASAVHVWDTATDKVASIPVDGEVRQLTWSEPPAKRLLVESRTESMTEWTLVERARQWRAVETWTRKVTFDVSYGPAAVSGTESASIRVLTFSNRSDETWWLDLTHGESTPTGLGALEIDVVSGGRAAAAQPSGAVVFATDYELQFRGPGDAPVSPVFPLTGQSQPPDVAISSDGRRALAMLETQVCLYRVGGDVSCENGVPRGAFALAASSDLTRFAIPADYGEQFRVQLWGRRQDTRLEQLRWEGNPDGAVIEGQWSPSAEYFMWSAYLDENGSNPGIFRWDTQTQDVAQLSTPEASAFRFVDDKTVLVEGFGSQIWWDVADDNEVEPPTFPCLDEELNARGNWFVSDDRRTARRCATDGTVETVDLTALGRGEAPLDNDQDIAWYALSDSGDALAVLRLESWPLARATIDVHTGGQSWTVDVADQTGRFAGGSGQSTAQGGDLLYILGNLTLEVDPRQQLVKIQYERGTAVWDYTSGDLVLEVRDRLNDVAYDPGRSYIAVSNLSGRVTLFDRETSTRIGALEGLPSPVRGAALTFSPTGQLAAIGSDEIIVWGLNAETHVEQACRIANRTLTTTERQIYLADGYNGLTPCA